MGFFSALFGAGSALSNPVVQAAIERAVDRIDPRLRLVGGYPGNYQAVVARAYAYSAELAASIPGPIAVDREHFASDSTVHAMFGSMRDMNTAMCLSQAMRAFRQDRPDAQEVYAVLGMRRFERKTLGMEFDGEILRREVPQTVVYFADHTLSDPASSEEAVREKVAWAMFDRLLDQVAERITARKRQKLDLENRRTTLLAQQHGADAAASAAAKDELACVRSELCGVVSELELSRYADDFAAVLGTPEAYIRLESVAMLLDSMGVMRNAPGANDVREVRFTDLLGGDRRRWTLTLVHCQQMVVPSMTQRLEDARRWMAI